MRTSKYFRYLIAMIMALGTSANVFAQERVLKIYFNETSDTATGPRIFVTDDHPNSSYDIPFGTKVSAQGSTWANGARWFGLLQQTVTDRILANYEDSEHKSSHLKISFMDEYGNSTFPYEVNNIQWNIMNDLFSGTIFGDGFDNLQISTVCTPAKGQASSYTEEHWELNPFARNSSFTQSDFPSTSGLVLNGLKSFELREKNFFKIKIPIIGWTIYSEQTELNDRCREFIKAGWNGSNTEPKVRNSNGQLIDIEGDDSYWAFKVKFTLPDIRLRFADARSGYVIKTDETNVKLLGEITAHAGAVVPIENPQDPDDFHYEFSESSNGQIIQLGKVNYLGRSYNNGTITAIKKAGTVDVTVRLMRGNREVSSYTQTIYVRDYEITANAPQIAIAFADGNKGYDVTVGDDNAQIQGVITKGGKDNKGNTVSTTTATNNLNGYHFEYSSGNTDVATIDKTTGKITAKKEGDVNISAVLMNGNVPITEFYNYTLHVFAKHEGLEFRRINTYKYSESGNTNYHSWKVTATNSQSYEWQSNNLLRVNTSISGNFVTDVNNWKQIASFSTNSSNHWRGIVQEIAFDLYVPKYTKASARYSMAGNVSIGTSNKGNCRYGFELYYLNEGSQISLDEANNRLLNYSWDTYTTGDFNSDKNAIIRWGTDRYNSSGVGDGGYYDRATDNVTSPKRNENRKLTVYFAAIAYLWNNYSYPGDVSIGFKGTPEYTYYASVTYHKNDGTVDIWGTDEFETQSKTETKALFSQWSDAPTRDGYTFLGWSTDPNSETAIVEYNLRDKFSIYDTENGGGMGPVNLYAIWKANKYIVELRNLPTSNYQVLDHVIATYDADMPSVNVDGATLTAPYIKGYDFGGYYDYANNQYTTCYYDKDMKSVHVWDKTDNLYISAKWLPHTVIVYLDADGGEYNGNAIRQFTILYGAKLPTTAEGVQKPSKNGYTFGGYFTKRNGAGTQYYMADMTVAGNGRWYVDEPEVTLYAKWIPNNYLVTLNRQGGTGGTGSVAGTYGQPLPSGNTAPTKVGYEFKGYYSNANQDYAESIGQDYGGKQYYDKDMNGVEPWDKTEGGTIYAHWAPKTFIVTFDGTNGAIVPKQLQYDSQKPISDVIYNSDGVVKISFKYGGQCPSQITNGKFKKAGFKLVGFYDSNNVQVATVDVDHPEDRNIYFNESSGYWTRKDGNFVWNCTHDVNLTARYEPKYTVRDGDIIDFGTEYLEVGIDWENSMVHDLLGAAEAEKEAGRISSTNPVMVFDIRNARYLDNSSKKSDDLMVPLRDKDFISPNLLVYLGEGAYDVIENEIKTDGTCPGLVVTDRFPIKIPYAFNASKASYARDAGITDAETQQAQKSSWGTLCLPYSVKNNTSDVQYYWLRSMTNNYMEFEEFEDDVVIPANTPVLYRRTDGDVSSRINIVETNKNVPKNMAYQAVTIDYANVGNLVEGTYPLVSADATIHEWEFRGNLQTSVFCGKDYNKDKTLPAGAVQVDKGDVYYFKQNKFTHLLPRRVVNGVTYAAGKMTLYPYRAYFYLKDTGSSAKVSQYSILVMGEDGTLDITDLLFGDGEGDGKIYDLSGVRVMKPVKGRLYIVNGQKKVYR